MIEFEGVSYEYGVETARGVVGTDGREQPALDDVTCSFSPGEFVLLVGPNGSGKSTLARLCNGLLEPDSGTVLVNDTPVRADLVAARSAVAMTFQNPRDAFVSSTIGADVAFGPENLGLDRSVIDRRVNRSLEAVGMAGRNTERLTRLSGGEQTRVAIAGALAMDPDHLVLDEPFAGLDRSVRRRIRERLDALGRTGTGVLCITHDPTRLFDVADRIVALAHGRIVADGPPESVRNRLETLDLVGEPSEPSDSATRTDP